MLHDLATIITGLGSDAVVQGDTIKVGGEVISCTLTGKVVARNNSSKFVLGVVSDGAATLAHNFVNIYR